ncbi:hypothetical protein B0H14DRAFT_2496216 [Mycena olivaceomarginata]|nr:hypothetical protein B0H14DRAFT_2496216 [Mycena olivaceomarginata]
MPWNFLANYNFVLYALEARPNAKQGLVCRCYIRKPGFQTPLLCSSILRLRNAQATRSGIVSAFYTHLIDNPAIRRDDPIIVFFAGHGAKAEGRGRTGELLRIVESICPSFGDRAPSPSVT